MKERTLVRCRGFDVGYEDHGMPVLHGVFEGEGTGQGLGYSVEMGFILRFLDVFGVDRVQKVNGKPCWITRDNDRIFMIEPLLPDEGKTFDLERWRAWVKDRGVSASELRGR